MESKTPRLDCLSNCMEEENADADAWLDIRRAVAEDISALEALHAEELRQREDSYQEALIKLQNRNDAVLEGIAQAKREAYEDAAKMVYKEAGACYGLLEKLREKAGKL